MEKYQYVVESAGNIARKLIDKYGPATYLLSGALGAGKTTLVKEMCAHLGVVEPTSSPTFSIVNEYASKQGRVFHLDCYRLKTIEEALEAGLEEIFATEDAAVFVEWPAVIEPLLPTGVVRLRLEHTPDGTARSLTVTTGPTPTQR